MSANPRFKLYAALHAAAAKAGLDDDAYRAMLQDRTGKASAKELSDGQIRAVLDHLNGVNRPKASARRDDSATSRKIRALWLSLWNLGVVRNPEETALVNFMRPIAKVDALHWLSARDAFRVIEALKDMGKRNGVRWDAYPTPQQAIIAAQLARLEQMMASTPDAFTAVNQEFHELSAVAYNSNNPSAQLNKLVENLGHRIRALVGEAGNAPAA